MADVLTQAQIDEMLKGQLRVIGVAVTVGIKLVKRQTIVMH